MARRGTTRSRWPVVAIWAGPVGKKGINEIFYIMLDI
jgi:hypothetical protein